MEERDTILIEKYLAQELTASERAEVEMRVKRDTEFRNEFNEYKLAMEAVKIAQREELKNRFAKRDKILDNQNKKPSTGNSRNIWMFSAIAAAILMLIWFYFNQTNVPGLEPIIAQDSTTVNQITRVDTLKTEEPKAELRATNEKEEKKNIITNKYDGDELYAANFEPYVDESMDVAMRGDEMTPFDQFLQSYAERDFINAISSFNQMKESQKQNPDLKFLYANALMATSKEKEAKAVLEEVLSDTRSNYQTEVSLYIALANLKMENLKKAKEYLELYLRNPEAKDKTKAKQILSHLQ